MKLFKKLLYVLCFVLVVATIWLYPLIVSNSKPNLVKLGVINNSLDQIEDNSFFYPNLDIKAPFTLINKDPFTSKNWSLFREALTKGIAISYPYQDLENNSGLLYVIGHSTDRYPHTYSSIFSSLDKSNAGESFYLKKDEQVYEYKVTEKQILNPRDIDGFLNLESSDTKIQKVAIVTCWPLFTTKNRLVVVGERNLENSL